MLVVYTVLFLPKIPSERGIIRFREKPGCYLYLMMGDRSTWTYLGTASAGHQRAVVTVESIG